MKRLKSIDIKGQYWKIKYEPDIKDDDGNPCWGLCVYEKRTILIDSESGPRQQKKTLNHEALHALFAALHIDLDPDLEERIVNSVEEFYDEKYYLKLKPRKKRLR